MNEIERLNYVNGRRLDAADFQLEQHYLIAMRRRLNRGLFTPGVVNGLEVKRVSVSATELSKKEVTVETGVALDPRGAEIVLTQKRTLSVPAQRPANKLGYFLVISYAEERLTGEDPDCGPPLREAARVREEPQLAWTETLPSHRDCGDCGTRMGTELDCGIVLALVSLTDACEIKLVDLSLRELANPTHSSQATAYALEGEKDIDVDNPKVLHFQVRGGTPSAVTLYLWAGEFSSLFYSEMGQHEHTIRKATLPLSEDTAVLPDHRHDLTDHTHLPRNTNIDGNVESEPADLTHGHRLLTINRWIDASGTPHPGPLIEMARANWDEVQYNLESQLVATGGPIVPWIEPFVGSTVVELALSLGGRVNLDASQPVPETGGVRSVVGAHRHTHSLTTDVSVSSEGSPEHRAGTAPAYQYFTGLKVELDGADITTGILRPLSSFGGLLGNGTNAHDLVNKGTEAIDLLDVARAAGKTIDAGPHTLKFSVKERPAPEPPNGGKLLYNLFVE